MFSFPTDDRRNRVLLRINDSNWSAVSAKKMAHASQTGADYYDQPLSFETVGMETEVVMPSASGNEEIHVGLKVSEGLGDVGSPLTLKLA